MEVLRTRLCEWQGAGIDAIAMAPEAIDGVQVPEPRLAVGRSNGVVELWDTSTYHLQSCTPGHGKRKWRSLVWMPGGAGDRCRLFGAGVHKNITEWDPVTLQPLEVSPSGGGAVWCLVGAPDRRMFASCEDGTVRLFQLGEEPGDLANRGRFNVGKQRILSVAPFGSGDFFAGGCDGRISKWSVDTRTCEASMTVEKAIAAPTLVWALACLGDHGLASGDSLGHVNIWDPIACVVLRRFAQHQSDVLTLCPSEDGNYVIAGSMDTRISIFHRHTGAEEKWVSEEADFGHTHDIKAIALASGSGPILSGGEAGVLRVHPLRSALAAGASASKNVLYKCSSLSPLLQTACVAQASRLLMCQRSENIEFWYLQRPKGEPITEAFGPVMPEGSHVLRVKLEGGDKGQHISASALSPDGGHLAASDETGLRLFQTCITDLEVRRLATLPSELAKSAARALLFCTPALLAIAPRASSEVLVLDVTQPAVAARFSEHRAPVHLLAASAGGEWLASADLSGVTHIFSLDTLAHHAQVPIGGYEGFPTALTFDAGRLIIATSTHAIIIFDVEAQTLAAGVAPIRIPETILRPNERVCGVVVPPGTKDKLLLWGHSFLLKLTITTEEEATAESPKPKKKPRLDSEPEPRQPEEWKLYDGYQHILALCGLEEAQWGQPVLPSGTGGAGLQQTPEKKKKKRNSSAEAPKEEDSKSRPMVLTLEVTPKSLSDALPDPFERKQFNNILRKSDGELEQRAR